MEQKLNKSITFDAPNILICGVSALVGDSLSETLRQSAIRVRGCFECVGDLKRHSEVDKIDAFVFFAGQNASAADEVKEINTIANGRPIIVLCSTSAGQFWMSQLRNFEIDCLLSTDVGAGDLPDFIRLACRGHRLIAGSCVPQACDEETLSVSPELLCALSTEETQIMKFLSKGCSNKTIANETSSSEATVKLHLRRIMKKLHVENRTQAAVIAATHGMQQPVTNGTAKKSVASRRLRKRQPRNSPRLVSERMSN